MEFHLLINNENHIRCVVVTHELPNFFLGEYFGYCGGGIFKGQSFKILRNKVVQLISDDVTDFSNDEQIHLNELNKFRASFSDWSQNDSDTDGRFALKSKLEQIGLYSHEGVWRDNIATSPHFPTSILPNLSKKWEILEQY